MPRARADRAEAREVAEDEAAQERRPEGEAPRVAVTVPGWIRGIHPDTGEMVTFVPGEALPSWVVAALPSGHTDPADARVTLLETP